MFESVMSFTAGEFLFLYIVLLVIAAGLSVAIASLMRPDGIDQIVDQTEDLAMLANGSQRFGEATITRLLTERAISVDVNGTFLRVRYDLTYSGVDLAVANATPGRWKFLIKATQPFAEPIRQRLIAKGLMMDGPAFAQSRVILVLPFLVVALFGGLRQADVVALDGPTTFLAILILLTLGIAVERYRNADQCTRAGKNLLNKVRQTEQRLSRAPTRNELSHAVALFGTKALVGSSYDIVHKLSKRSSGSGYSGGCGGGSDGGDSGGGCGGGCGD